MSYKEQSISNTSTNNFIPIEEVILDIVDRVTNGRKVLVTGPSGSGKSYIARKVEEKGLPSYDLDSFGYQEGNKWLTNLELIRFDLPGMKDGFLLAGTSDNIWDLDWFVDDLILLKPDLPSFRKTQAAKATQMKEDLKNNSHEYSDDIIKGKKQWIDEWESFSQWDEVTYENYFMDQETELESLFERVGKDIHVASVKLDLPQVVKGWEDEEVEEKDEKDKKDDPVKESFHKDDNENVTEEQAIEWINEELNEFEEAISDVEKEDIGTDSYYKALLHAGMELCDIFGFPCFMEDPSSRFSFSGSKDKISALIKSHELFPKLTLFKESTNLEHCFYFWDMKQQARKRSRIPYSLFFDVTSRILGSD